MIEAEHPPRGNLTLVVCGAPPAAEVGVLIRLSRERRWTVRAVPTPDARSFVDIRELEELTGNKVEVGYRLPGDERPPRPDGVIVAPATFNTINKAALGITDTHALGVIAEAIGRAIPVVVVPWVNEPLAVRQPFRRSLADLQAEGVQILVSDEPLQPRPDGAGGAEVTAFPWKEALDLVDGVKPAEARGHGA